MNDRLPPIPETQWTPEQRAAARIILDGPRGTLAGPFVPLLRSPELMDHVQRLGEYLRYRSALGTHLSELAILVVAREWDQQVEWAIHAPIALQAGIAPAVVDAIARRERPEGMTEEETAVYEMCVALHRERQVGDAAWAAVVRLFGEQGAVDLVTLNGYYALLAMVMNAARTPAPASSAPPLA
ncbi:MAG: carboxymuconolactone decarboxylase family protein [Telluria sp.]